MYVFDHEYLYGFQFIKDTQCFSFRHVTSYKEGYLTRNFQFRSKFNCHKTCLNSDATLKLAGRKNWKVTKKM